MSTYFDKLLSLVKDAADDGPSQFTAQERYSWCFSSTLDHNVKSEIIEETNPLTRKQKEVAYTAYLDKIKTTNDEVYVAYHKYKTTYPPPKESALFINDEELESLFKLLEEWSDWITKTIKPPLPQPKKPMDSFESLFKDRDNASTVKALLDFKGYTENGKWKGLTTKKKELLAAYYVLRPILKPGYKTTQARIFYTEFGLDDDYLDERHFRDEPFNDSTAEFKNIFSKLLPE